MTKRVLLLAVLGSILFCDAAAAQPGYNRWKIVVTPYFWLSDSSGDITVDGTTVPVDVSFSDLFEFISWGISAHVEARKRVWPLIFDLHYRDLDSQEVSMSTDLRNILAEASVGYQVMDWFQKTKIEVIGGVRYFNTRIEIRDAPSEPSGEQNWVDPIVGGRVSWQPAKAWTLSARGDVGGFGIGSDISWNASGVVAYRVYDFSFVLGYRAWHADYETGSGADLFKYDVTTFGPGLGMTFHFGGKTGQ
jgi:hypothetical protein